jgi:predicted acyltransferase
MLKKRIESVEVLRGFIIAVMILANTPGHWSTIYPLYYIQNGMV